MKLNIYTKTEVRLLLRLLVISVLFFYSFVSFSQSPFELDKSRIDILYGNASIFRNSETVEVHNVDSVSHLVTWEVVSLDSDVSVEVIDHILHYPAHLTTNCGTSSAMFTTIEPNQMIPLGIFKMNIHNIESFDFPYTYKMYLVNSDDCSTRLDSFDVIVNQADLEDYEVFVDQSSMTIYLDENTGELQLPHEELFISNNSNFSIDVRFRIHDESLPKDLQFLVDDIFPYNSVNLGDHDICMNEEGIILHNRYGVDIPSKRRFKFREVSAPNISQWEFSSYETTVDILLPGCDTILDSFVLKIQRGITSSTEFIDSESIIIAPNPVSDLLMIKSEHHLSDIEIYSLSGERLLKENNSVIDVSTLSEGLYILKAKTDDNREVLKRFLKVD